ncbi:YbaB/EbfC family nucleoid-associated protein [Marinitoga litoralis]|uniref:YbaB/EbfC family nucleoid-associated protein n=1 Tax=Marinitoga litoralis TaxID=570855 RepID=UPI001961169C|nr:YbaB/EbfC family nucleoid-associated protein [Marinitoga litoralis]MBM7559954.1 DNA-binding YbaB/EbfC family protein [Marinitoga litoralis]
MAKKIRGLGGRSLKSSGGKKNDIMKLMQEAQKTQELMEQELKAFESELAIKEFEATSGGGVVKVIATGDLKIKDIEISEELEDEDFDIIKDMIVAATNEVLEKAKNYKEEETEKISQKYLGGLNLGM